MMLREHGKRLGVLVIALSLFLSTGAVSHAAVVTFGGGSTSVELDSTTVTALVDAGITPSAISPGTLIGLTAQFPVTGGLLDTDSSDIFLTHSGGLSFAGSGSTLDVLNFVINANLGTSTGVVTGDAVLNGTSVGVVPLFNIGGGLQLTLTSEAAGALDAAFGLPGLTGAVIGVAAPAPEAIPEPGSIALVAGGLALVLLKVRRA